MCTEFDHQGLFLTSTHMFCTVPLETLALCSLSLLSIADYTWMHSVDIAKNMDDVLRKKYSVVTHQTSTPEVLSRPSPLTSDGRDSEKKNRLERHRSSVPPENYL